MRGILGTIGCAAALAVGCAAGEPGADDETGSGEDAVTSSATPPKRETHFASGDVDLTKYTKAGAAEWKDFEASYKGRHTKPAEKDAWDNVVKRTKEKLNGSHEESLVNFVALKAYTLETFWFITSKPRIDQDYKLINTALRNVDTNPSDAAAKKTLASVEGYVKAATSAVNSMPAVKGVVHRRVYRADCDAACEKSWLDPYKAGMFVREPTFLSTSEKESETCFFRGQAHFVIETTGVAHSVKFLSDMPQEEEAVFAPGTVFKVEKVTKSQKIVCDDPGWQPEIGHPGRKAPTTETVIDLRAVVD